MTGTRTLHDPWDSYNTCSCRQGNIFSMADDPHPRAVSGYDGFAEPGGATALAIWTSASTAPVATALPNPAGAVSIDSRSDGKHRSRRYSGPPREPANNSAAAGVANIGAFAIPVHLPLSAGVADPTDGAAPLAFYEEATRRDDSVFRGRHVARS